MTQLPRTLASALTVSLFAPVAWAQLSTAQLSGRVTDESGAVLPGVTVTAMQTATGFVRSDVTDGTGSYSLSNLPTGPYRLEADCLWRRPQAGAPRRNIQPAQHVQLGAPHTCAGLRANAHELQLGSFGRITSMEGSPRIMQFGVKYGF